jgi:phosphatidate cytidylyltransferase
MALNVSVFRTRALTALIFVAVMFTGMLLSAWTFFILFSIIHFGCWIEYQKMVALIDPEYATITPFHKYGVMLAGWCMMLYFCHDGITLFGLRLSAIGWWMGLLFVFILPIVELLFAGEIKLKNIGYSALGLIYISLSWGLLMDLYEFVQEKWAYLHVYRGPFFPVLLIVCMWINDTMAYLTGSFIGRTPFSKISPKKTWEGTIGGVIFCVLTVGLLLSQTSLVSYFTGLSLPAYHWYVIAGIAAITGIVGDLLESKLKRMANIKDSGSIMPGHGGFLDRFDSLLFATPFVWAYIQCLHNSNTIL